MAGAGLFTPGVPYRRARSVTDEALGAIERAGDRSVFLFVNYNDAHWPYDPPPPFDRRWPGALDLHDPCGWEEVVQEVMSGARSLIPDEHAELSARYDGELAYLDHHLGRLLEGLRRHPRWEETLVIVTSDHGEALGEHGFLWHGVNLYGELLRVPLVIRPGRATPSAPRPGSVHPGPIQSVDVFATVAAHAGVETPNVDGKPWARERTLSFSWLYVPVFFASRNPDRFTRELRSVEDDRWKLVVSSTHPPELYLVESDPGEGRNLAGRQPLTREAMRRQLAIETPPSPGSPRPLGPETLEGLRALGYHE